eukprot:TRINITY_DN34337_c0_g1_i1.p2 TRINITY_DN34337_c0_g1~~TRINITY_DN34337_c0_g1_i1.p2  ORF type:complete len:239 (+),score=57.04 TRINITY_DN34337_c0_g1_i1:149-865(+)
MPTGVLGLELPAEKSLKTAFGKGGDRRGSAASGQTKRKAGGAGDQEDMPDLAELVKFTAMLSLSNAQVGRELAAVAMQTLLVKKEKPIYAALKASMDAYDAAAKQSKTKATGPPPHTWTWQAMVEHYMSKFKEGNMGEQVQKLETYVQTLQQVPTGYTKAEFIAESVLHCKLKKCFDSTQTKVQVSVAPGTPAAEAWKVIKHAMITMDAAVVKRGQAPRTNLERRVQALLDTANDMED